MEIFSLENDYRGGGSFHVLSRKTELKRSHENKGDITGIKRSNRVRVNQIEREKQGDKNVEFDEKQLTKNGDKSFLCD